MQVLDVAAQIKTYLDQEQWGKAIALGEHVLDRNPAYVEIYPLLGRALAVQGQLEEATRAYQEGLRSLPDHPEIHADLGELYRQQQQVAKAIAHYQRALSLKPNWAVVHYNLAVLFHQLDERDAAIDHYLQVIALNSNHGQARFNLAVAYDQQGLLEKAIEHYRLAIQCQPEESPAYSNLGSAFSRQARYEEAIAVYQQGLAHHPEDAQLFNNLGQALGHQGQLGDAIASYQQAIAIDPTLTIAHHNLGSLCLRQQDYPQAVSYFQTTLAIEPDNVLALSDCGHALMLAGQWRQALDYLRRAMMVQPEFVDVFCQRAMGLEGGDSLEQARRACAQFLQAVRMQAEVIQIQEFLWQTYWFVGEVLYEYGAVEQAEGYYSKAIHLMPYQVEPYLKLGNCYAQQQRRAAAVAAYRMGLALNPIHPQLCFELGNVLEQQQQYQAAIESYQQMLSPLKEQVTVTPYCEFTVPQGIFPRTADWIRATAQTLEGTGCQYTEIKVENRQQDSVDPLDSAEGYQRSDCGGVTCSLCMAKLIQSFESVPLGRHVFRCAKQQPVPSPNTFVVTIPEGRAWISPQTNAWVICKQIAIITPDHYILGDLSRFFPWSLPGCQKHDLSQHPLLQPASLPPVENIEGTVAILSTLSGHVYYHWMIDLLPRLGLLRRSGLTLDEIDWFVVNRMDQPFQRETLEALGIPRSKVIESDLHPHIQGQRMIVPSFPGHLDWVPPDTIDFLRQAFLSRLDSDSPSRIYISRSQANYRQVINEADVIAQLEKFGFVTVWLENLTVLEQVNLFASAQVIVAAHGSSLTNLVFCQAGTQVLELFSPNYVRTDYWMVSQQLDLQHYYLMGRNFDCYPVRQLMHQNPLTEDILVDLDALDVALQAMDVESPSPLTHDFMGAML